jgi:phosphogluconate dehydratase
MHPVVSQVTDRIRARSVESRTAYLARIAAASREGRQRGRLSCGNLAHGFAACDLQGKQDLRGDAKANVAIVSRT